MERLKKEREIARLRASELVEKMTTDEMISQLLHNSKAIKRLSIPAYNWWNEGLHGAARGGSATVFPQAIGLAATFNRDLMKEIGEVVSTEQRARYNVSSKEGDRGIYKGLTVWSPNINIFRDPRWGRGQETYGEDPLLTSAMAVSFINGLQGDESVLKTASTAKHFLAHSGPEATRHSDNITITAKDREETYLPAFRSAVEEAGCDGIMGAYTRVNGTPCSASPLIEEKLRREWGFEGVFISDCWAIRDFHEGHKVTALPEESAAMALKAGCDLNCGCSYAYLNRALSKGLVTKNDIKKACIRVFTTRFLLGLFDEATPYDSLGLSDIGTRENHALSLKAARESIVLLENRDSFLPLSKKDIKRLAVIGPNADSRDALVGNYHGRSDCNTTPLEGIRELLGENVRLYYAEGSAIAEDRVERLGEEDDRISEAVAALKESECGVVCLGLNEHYEGEAHSDRDGKIIGDRENLYLPEPQRRLLRALDRVGKPIILVLLAGSAIDPELYKLKNVMALLQAWYPGERGGLAIAEIIFGITNPSGRLPITFYRGDEELPPFSSYSMENRTYRYFKGEPLYPFGYGLSYTTFKYSDFGIKWDSEKRFATLSFTLKNTGNRKGRETSLIYAATKDEDAPPNPVLLGFTKTELSSGESKRIELTLPSHLFTVVGKDGKRRKSTAEWELSIGSSTKRYNSEEKY